MIVQCYRLLSQSHIQAHTRNSHMITEIHNTNNQTKLKLVMTKTFFLEIIFIFARTQLSVVVVKIGNFARNMISSNRNYMDKK